MRNSLTVRPRGWSEYQFACLCSAVIHQTRLRQWRRAPTQWLPTVRSGGGSGSRVTSTCDRIQRLGTGCFYIFSSQDNPRKNKVISFVCWSILGGIVFCVCVRWQIKCWGWRQTVPSPSSPPTLQHTIIMISFRFIFVENLYPKGSPSQLVSNCMLAASACQQTSLQWNNYIPLTVF